MLRPLTCYLSQLSRPQLQCLIEAEDEEADCSLEKPLPLNELIALLKILNLK